MRGSAPSIAPCYHDSRQQARNPSSEPQSTPKNLEAEQILAHSEQEKNARDVPAVAARIAVALVFALNVQCALQFVLWPEAFAGAYELSGVAGEAAVRGLGVAFLMWNATYPAVIASPRRFRALYVVVLVQQAIGLVGETAILLGLPGGHEVLAASILRFIAFDAAGLILMAAAFAWLRK